jgi:hypothetical protein
MAFAPTPEVVVTITVTIVPRRERVPTEEGDDDCPICFAPLLDGAELTYCHACGLPVTYRSNIQCGRVLEYAVLEYQTAKRPIFLATFRIWLTVVLGDIL